MDLLENLQAVFHRKKMPDRDEYLQLLESVITVLEHEDEAVRPRDRYRLPGGLVYLDAALPVLILPDLHARTDFFLTVMEYEIFGTASVASLLIKGELQVLCLGDGFHAERRARDRWKEAFEEYTGSYRLHKAMDAEMRESLTLMEMVMVCKKAARTNFHFLKGNHENILNEEGNGNHPFRKFAWEGEMVCDYVTRFYGDDFLATYALFEKSLPLFAIGGNFIASHAEPALCYTEDQLINTRDNPEVVLGLTWTDNDEAVEGSVRMMLDAFLPDRSEAVYLGGHRSVSTRYNLRADDLFIQIHNPDSWQFALLQKDKRFDPEIDIITLAEE